MQHAFLSDAVATLEMQRDGLYHQAGSYITMSKSSISRDNAKWWSQTGTLRQHLQQQTGAAALLLAGVRPTDTSELLVRLISVERD